MELFFKDPVRKERIKKWEIVEKDGEKIYKETKEWKDYKFRQTNYNKLLKSNLPSHSFDLNLDDYVGDDRDKIDKLKLYVEKFEEKFNSIHLYFWSTENGTQKTTVASIVGKLLIEKGFSSRFTSLGNLLKLLSGEAFEENSNDLLNSFRTCDFLIIDDAFDKRKATIYRSGFQIPFLDEFLRTRLEVNKKATCFTSNFSIQNIDEEVFGSSLKHLIKRNIIDPFFFASSFELRNSFDVDGLWS